MSRKVLLASINVGGGHTALRDSFVQALAKIDPQQRRYQPVPWQSTDTKMESFYEFVVHKIPRFQQTVYDSSDSRLGIRICSYMYPSVLREVKELLATTRPDAVISTHLVLSLMFARAKRQLKLDIPLIASIPDYGSTTRGFFPDQEDLRGEFCIVTDETTRRQLIEERKFPQQIIHHSGFLTREPFAALAAQLGDAPKLPKDKRAALFEQLRAQHPQMAGLDPAKPTLIFLGGSAWTSKTAPVLTRLRALPDLRERLNILVVCGKNPEFQQEIEAQLQGAPEFAVFGFVNAQLMANLLAISDHPVLGSLAPATMQELLELRCGPLMLFHYIRGTEGPHVDYIEEHQIGLYEPDPELMVASLAELTGVTPARARISSLLRGFPARAAEIRRANVERALKLADFLDLACGVPALPSAESISAATGRGSGERRAVS